MTGYYILAWLYFYYAVVVLLALVGFWIQNKYRENERVAQIENGTISRKPMLIKAKY